MCMFVSRTVKHLLKLDNPASSISKLVENHSVSWLLTALLASLLVYHFSNLSPLHDDCALNVLLSLIEEIELDETIAYQFLK